MAVDPASFRDPDGRVVLLQDRVFRAFTPQGADRFRAFRESGLHDHLTGTGRMVESRPVDAETASRLAAEGAEAALFLEHPRVPFLSYAYEWCFGMLRDAGLHQLDLTREALGRGYVLKDATPFNVQFLGARPVQIDVTSFEPWKEGTAWKAYNQFCRLFLNPLLLTALTGVPFQPWLRGRLEGIAPEELSSLLPWTRKLRRGVFSHVLLQGWLNRKFARSTSEMSKTIQNVSVSRERNLHLIDALHATLSRLRVSRGGSHWLDYEEETPSGREAQEFKDRFVEEAVRAAAPATVWDLGANTGRYSLIAARHAGLVIALERDPEVVEALYRRMKEGGTANVLCLVMDLLDPSPGLGWDGRERRPLAGRGRADFALCLALVHHLSISGNLPLGRFVDWLSERADGGVIEFVPKEDPMAQRLLRWREDVFDDYRQEPFESHLERHFRIRERAPLPGTKRTLYVFGR